jgi:predicted membrane protein
MPRLDFSGAKLFLLLECWVCVLFGIFVLEIYNLIQNFIYFIFQSLNIEMRKNEKEREKERFLKIIGQRKCLEGCILTT